MNNKLHHLLISFSVAAGLSVSAHATTLPVIDLDAAKEYMPLMVASDDPANWIAPLGLPFDGVAKLLLSRSDGNFGCSGSLLDGGAFLMTAAHCVTDDDGNNLLNSATISFQGGTVTTTSTEAFVFPTWDGHSLGNNDDIAILKLDTPVNSIPGFGLATGSPVLQPVLHAGYGLIGTGSTGAIPGTFGTLHYGYNVYDAVWSGGSLAYDFDDGTAAHDVFCIIAGTCDAGLPFPNEAMIASGDSGGPSFVLEGGLFKLVGVHSFGATFGVGFGDINDELDSSFGEVGGDTYLLPHAAWIASITAVPEPQTYLMLLAGLFAIGMFAQRRTNHHQA